MAEMRVVSPSWQGPLSVPAPMKCLLGHAFLPSLNSNTETAFKKGNKEFCH